MNLAKFGDILLKKLDRWLEAFVQMLPNLVVAIVVYFVFYYIGKMIREVFEKVLNRFSENKSVNQILGVALYILCIGIGIFVALGILKLDKAVTSLLAGAGVIGLALGFAFQEIAANFISGALIAFTRPYKVGDIVQVDDYEGEVLNITLRTTSLETYTGLEVIIPNKNMITQTMTNFTSTPKRRIDLQVGVSYASDLEQVERVTRAALEELDVRIKTIPIDIFYREFGDSSINLYVHLWIKYTNARTYYKAIHDCIVLIKKNYDNEGITIPFPIRTIDMSLSKDTFKGVA